jgi:hypothetical protein
MSALNWVNDTPAQVLTEVANYALTLGDIEAAANLHATIVVLKEYEAKTGTMFLTLDVEGLKEVLHQYRALSESDWAGEDFVAAVRDLLTLTND